MNEHQPESGIDQQFIQEHADRMVGMTIGENGTTGIEVKWRNPDASATDASMPAAQEPAANEPGQAADQYHREMKQEQPELHTIGAVRSKYISEETQAFVPPTVGQENPQSTTTPETPEKPAT